MTIEFDEKGKFFTNIIEKDRVQVMIQTSTHRIVGTVHVAKEHRLKDELDLTDRFIAVTDAVVYLPDGEPLYQTDFLAVQRSEIVWVMPMNKTTEPGQGV